MDIKVISRRCAKIVISSNEADKMGIGFDDFYAKDEHTKRFLTYIFVLLGDMGIIASPNDTVTIEVFEQENGDMIIYISASYADIDIERQDFEHTIITRSPDMLFELATTITKMAGQDVSNDRLYYHNGSYCLYFETQLPQVPADDMTKGNKIAASKIKEYGILLCDTPFEKLLSE